jgi:uncharacterized protein
MAAKFVLKKGSTGKFRFNLVATNGQVIATSEAYESKASAIKGIESVKRNAQPLRSTTRLTSSQAAVPLDAGIGLAYPAGRLSLLVGTGALQASDGTSADQLLAMTAEHSSRAVLGVCHPQPPSCMTKGR